MIHVRHVTPDDRAAWLAMRCDLWPDGAADHAGEIDAFFAGRLREPRAVLLAIGDEGSAVGFAELSIRRYAEDCSTDRVAYLEGWYVAPQVRRQGVGRALVESAEGWAVAQGCIEFASDALIDNEVSARAHGALGFVETVQARCFRKPLQETPTAAPEPVVIARAGNIRIRAAVIADADALAQLATDLGYPTSLEQMHTRLEQLLADDDYATLVAVRGTNVVGFIGTRVGPSYEADGLHGQIMALSIASDHRRRGIGRELLIAAESMLSRRGVREVVLNTSHHRADAHAFYERNGYTFTGRRYRRSLA